MRSFDTVFVTALCALAVACADDPIDLPAGSGGSGAGSGIGGIGGSSGGSGGAGGSGANQMTACAVLTEQYPRVWLNAEVPGASHCLRIQLEDMGTAGGRFSSLDLPEGWDVSWAHLYRGACSEGRNDVEGSVVDAAGALIFHEVEPLTGMPDRISADASFTIAGTTAGPTEVHVHGDIGLTVECGL